jgi:hypothetical protein
MPLTMVEPIAQAILEELQANLPAKIAALQPTFVPVLEMPAPIEYAFGDSDFLKGFPVIQVEPVRIRTENEDLAGRWQDHSKRIEVGVFVSASPRENLTRLLDRYARCVLEVLLDRRKAGAFLTGGRNFDLVWKDEEIDYGTTFPQEGQFTRALFIPMRAERRGVELHV